MHAKTLLATALSAAAILSATAATATTMVYETRAIDAGVNTADYKGSWAAQSSAITSTSLSDFNGTVPGHNAFAHLQVTFDLPTGIDILFQIAPDAGYGGALYLDGVELVRKGEDLWWGYNWTNSSELLQGGANSAPHVLDGYWAEGCCSGGQGGRFSLDDGQTWQALTVQNLDAIASVPEPATLVLLGAGLAGLGFGRRRLG